MENQSETTVAQQSHKRRGSTDDEASVTFGQKRKHNVMAVIGLDVMIARLKSGEYSDFEISVEDYVFNVHRFVIDGQSDVIDKMIKGDFKETVERRLKLDASKEVVAVLLWYMYTKQFDGSLEALGHIFHESYAVKSFKRIAIVTELYYVADYLLMADFKVKIFSALYQVWKSTILESRQLNEQYGKEAISTLDTVVAYVFRDDKPFDQIRRQLCWGLMALDETVCGESSVIGDQTICKNLILYPELCQRYRNVHRQGVKDIGQCRGCKAVWTHDGEVQWLSFWSPSSNDNVWLRCVCGFRGVCSLECPAVDAAICNHHAYCDECKASDPESHGDHFHRRGDGRIELDDDCDCDGSAMEL